MHQHPRHPPSTASPANSEQTNPIRSNNPRDRTTSSQASGSSDDFVSDRPQPDPTASMQRLNQVIQNFHTKAALIILHSRAELAPAYSSKTNEVRVNKWFNIELDETDDYLDDIKRWKRFDVQTDRPPPLHIEVYLTTDTLPQGQRLVVLDDDQKRWDVYNALEPRQADRTTTSRPEKSREILLERWTIELGEPSQPIPSDLPSILPHVYKKSIVLFRALFTYCNFLPSWKLIRKLGKSRSTMGMKVGYRIVDGDRLDSIARADNLNTSLYESSSPVTTEYSFGSTDSPAGPFSVHVKYRSNCDFRVDDSEELLSSRFIGIDDDIRQPSMRDTRDDSTQKIGSLPNDQRRQLLQRPELGQAYGSLSTFHQAGISTGTSPISALRAQKELGADSPSPQRPLPQHAQSHRSAAPKPTANTRRSSFSLQPFKAPTLAASPLGSSPLSASPRVSTKAVPTLGSLQEEFTIPASIPTAQQVSRRKQSSTENVVATASGSPRPAPVQRFQSSFAHRKNRLSSDRTTNKPDEDQTSSGKASAASSAQPGSGLMTEPARGGSSGSLEADSENISDFLKMLDQKKDLLTPASSSAQEASAKKTAVALSRFHKMRDSNAALSESMSSSLIVPKTSTSPNRQLTSQAGLATSTSPGGKPVSPHTAHTPFAPSRLSAAFSNDDVDKHLMNVDGSASPHESQEDTSTTVTNPGAIDIPNSPLIYKTGYRRSSSAQRRPLSSDDNPDLFRSASMGANTKQQALVAGEAQPPDSAADKQGYDHGRTPGQDTMASDSGSAQSSLRHPYRSRFARGGGAQKVGSHTSPAHGSVSSIGGTGASVEKTGESGSVSDGWRGGRHVIANPENKVGDDEDDVDLPFLMDASARS